VHGKLGLKPGCASFDVSLGCSGFVYGLSAITSFMKQNEMKKGVLFTADPYSKVVDPEERNTSLLFGDAATATLITESAELIPGRFTFGTLGEKADEIRLVDEKLSMNGLAVVKFVKKYIPADIRKNIEMNGLTMDEIDRFLLHQASRYMVRTVMKDLGIDEARTPFEIGDYGNTISSSIPILLEKEILQADARNFLISGFGIGFSWASCVLRRV
jgi:3-oxoacyl-[acyl-carrier-protein] synthase-3